VYKNCLHCGSLIPKESNFCGQCGQGVTLGEWEKNRPHYSAIIAFYLTIIGFIGASSLMFSQADVSFMSTLLVEILFAAIIVIYSLFNLDSILPLYTKPDVPRRVWMFNLSFPIFSSFLVYYSMDSLNTWLDLESSNTYLDNIDLDYPMLWTVISITLLAPIFEELAFRGYLFNHLLKVTSWQITVVATAFLFSLIHFSMVSLLWIFPFGLVLGYMRYRYNSLWLVMLIHFIHNLIVVGLDYYYAQSYLNEGWY